MDRARFPRQKVCGEFLSSEAIPALEFLGVMHDVAREGTRIQWLVIHLRAKHSHAIPLGSRHPTTPALGVSRSVLDTAIVDAACSAGVSVYQEARLLAVDRDGDRVAGIRIRHKGRALHLVAPWFIAADGRHSRFVRLTGRIERFRCKPLCGVKTHVPPAEGAAIQPAVHMSLVPGGYFGHCPVDGGRINVCGLIREAALKTCRGDVSRAVRAHVHGWPVEQVLKTSTDRWFAVSWVAPQVAHVEARNVLPVGDAFATVEPVVGRGMTLALWSGVLAARILADGRHLRPSRISTAYRAAWARKFGRFARLTWQIGQLCEQQWLARLLGVRQLKAVTEVMLRFLEQCARVRRCEELLRRRSAVA